MKSINQTIELAHYFKMNGVLNSGDTIYHKHEKMSVNFLSVEDENDEKYVNWNVQNENGEILQEGRSIVYQFVIQTEFVLKNQLKDLVTRAYNMGAFHHNAMARTLHKEIESFSLEEFIKRNL
jgi:hypothetical protein